MHASLVRTNPSVWLSYGNVDGRSEGAAARGFYRPFTPAVSEAVLLTRKWDFQEEETGSENEVTC